MPTYDYGCEACKHTWELEQRISADPVKKCPKCGKMKAKRMISGGSFILKGGGWYSDLYHKPAAAKSSPPSEGSSSTSTASAPSTPATPAASSGSSD